MLTVFHDKSYEDGVQDLSICDLAPLPYGSRETACLMYLQQRSKLKERTWGDGIRQAAEKCLEVKEMQDEHDCIQVGCIRVTARQGLTNRLWTNVMEASEMGRAVWLWDRGGT